MTIITKKEAFLMADKYNVNLNELSELIELTSKKVPELITNLLRTLYSAEAGANIGRAVGSLYKELLAAGLPQDLAAKMATEYMISFKDLTKLMQVEQGQG
jgi:hypothetical protein